VVNEKVVQTRLAVLEDRVSTVDGAPAADSPDKVARKGEDSPGKAEAERAPPAVAKSPFVPIETGSIAAKEETRGEIVFGAPVVTRAGQEFAVQLAAAPSVNALRQSWGQLTERHAGALASLQPRVVAPRGEGGIYRLLAGPFASKADAERICSELRVGAKACFATPYTGAPL
jgi:cell division septation protein DedD